MREYLLKKEDGTYSYHNDSHDECPKYVEKIEIPEGCNIITCENRKGNLVYFHWKSLDSDEFFLKDEKIWSNNFDETLSDFIEKNEGSVVIIWSRPTQPEELPFVDDEPKLETAEGYQLDLVGKNTFGSRSRARGETDSSYRDYLLSFNKPKRKTISVSVPIDSVQSTLKERQSQYGDFKEVASTTQYLLQMLSSDAMSDVQLEALHMICSKLSRIAHGDPNHKDSWHDIAGYATLVERSL